jgi:dihydrofolate reductase
MRKLIEASFVSLDGVVEGAERWALPYFANGENKRESLGTLMECDAFLLGRHTFEMLEFATSGAKGDAYYDRVRGMPKLVASTTIREPPRNVTVLTGDLAREIAALKRQPGKTIMRYGNGVLDQTLVANRLIDELHLSIIPVTVGAGRRLFEGVDTSRLALDLKGTKRFTSGIVTIAYACG